MPAREDMNSSILSLGGGQSSTNDIVVHVAEGVGSGLNKPYLPSAIFGCQ
jgi:hypothetical protein